MIYIRFKFILFVYGVILHFLSVLFMHVQFLVSYVYLLTFTSHMSEIYKKDPIKISEAYRRRVENSQVPLVLGCVLPKKRRFMAFDFVFWEKQTWLRFSAC